MTWNKSKKFHFYFHLLNFHFYFFLEKKYKKYHQHLYVLIPRIGRTMSRHFLLSLYWIPLSLSLPWLDTFTFTFYILFHFQSKWKEMKVKVEGRSIISISVYRCPVLAVQCLDTLTTKNWLVQSWKVTDIIINIILVIIINANMIITIVTFIIIIITVLS